MTSGKQLWPVRVPPARGESLVSWFCRSSYALGMEPKDLYRTAMPGCHLFSLDLDRHLYQPLIEALSRGTGIAPALIASLGFSQWAGSLFERDDGRSTLPHLPALGSHSHRDRSFGQQICPSCVAEDQEPFLRLTWRLSFVTACQRHRRLLIDRCWQCGSSINPLLAGYRYGFTHCHRCGERLDRAPVAKANHDVLVFQRSALHILKQGWATLVPSSWIYAHSYFWILRKLFRLLSTGATSAPLRFIVLEKLGADLHASSTLPPQRDFEHFNPHGRASLIPLVAFLLTDWPSTFISCCRGVGIHSWMLLKHEEQVPFAFWAPVTEKLNTPYRNFNQSELEAAKKYLKRRDKRPSVAQIRETIGTKLIGLEDVSEQSECRKAHDEGRYWKLDGVSPHVRRAAKEAARREGANIGPWVDQQLRSSLVRLRLLQP